MTSSQIKPVGEIFERRLSILLSKIAVTLSWILSSLKDVAASDKQISEIYAELENTSAQLSSLVKRRFPTPSNVEETGRFGGILREVGTNSRYHLTYCSSKMHAVMDRIERAARRDVPILITGESGVGKELVARFVHISSRRKHGPLVPVNCPAIPRDLFESQFFGYKQGAFTGALREYAGIVRSASGGTLFLDEIGELPLDLQPKLLRFLQEGEIHPLGDSLPTRVDVRVIASTNRNLEAEVKAGRFRADLLHRLNVLSFEIPPLRERREDIPLLLNFYLSKYSCLPGNYKVQFAPDTVDCLTAHNWSGNVRELNSLVLRLITMAEGDTIILPSDLPAEIASPVSTITNEGKSPDLSDQPVTSAGKIPSDLTLGEEVAILERERVFEALCKNDWSYSRAARQLGLSTYGLRKKYRRLFGNEPVMDITEK